MFKGLFSEVGILGDLHEAKRKQWENPSWWNVMIPWAWVVFLALCLFQWDADRKTALRQQTAIGLVTGLDPSNHQCSKYKFSVRNKWFSGCEGTDPSHAIQGSEVVVYYDPLNPTRNHLTGFLNVSYGDLFFVPILVTGIVGVPLLIFFKRRSYRRTTALNAERTSASH